MTPAADRLETVAVAYSQSQLSLLLSLFESEGIWVTAPSYQQIAVQWWMTVALGGVELRVHESQLEAALALLRGLEAPVPGKRIFSENRLVEWGLILGLFLTGFFVPPARIPAEFLLGETRATVATK
jgi:hypothetical protein